MSFETESLRRETENLRAHIRVLRDRLDEQSRLIQALYTWALTSDDSNREREIVHLMNAFGGKR